MKNKIKEFIVRECTGWSVLEVIWLVFAILVITALSIYWNENWIGFLSAISGVACVILTGKGKLSSYIFGTINTILYAYISFNAKYYGEVMLNIMYYLPMNFVGLYIWNKHMNSETQEVKKERLSTKWRIITTLICAAGIFLYGLLLKRLGGSLPFVDSMSTVMSVVAQILCVKRYMEQWAVWIVVDVVTIIMWAIAFSQAQDNIATLAMWSIYLINAIIMFIKWYKESKINFVKEESYV